MRADAGGAVEDDGPGRPLAGRLLGAGLRAAAVTAALLPALGLWVTVGSGQPVALACAAGALLGWGLVAFGLERRDRGLVRALLHAALAGAGAGPAALAAGVWAAHLGDPAAAWTFLARRLDAVLALGAGAALVGALLGPPLGAALLVRTRTAAPGPELAGWLVAAGGPAALLLVGSRPGGWAVAGLTLLGAGLCPLALRLADRLAAARDVGRPAPVEADPRPALAAGLLLTTALVAFGAAHAGGVVRRWPTRPPDRAAADMVIEPLLEAARRGGADPPANLAEAVALGAPPGAGAGLSPAGLVRVRAEGDPHGASVVVAVDDPRHATTVRRVGERFRGARRWRALDAHGAPTRALDPPPRGSGERR